MKGAVIIAAIAMPVALQAAQAQGGAADAQGVEELRRIGDAIAGLSQGTWAALMAGAALAVAALASLWHFARRLGRQVRRAADRLEYIERDMGDRKRPRLSWTECAVDEFPDFSRPANAQTVSVAITNVGGASATSLGGHVVYGLADSLDGLEGSEKIEIQMGAMLPGATKHQLIPVIGRDGKGAESPHRFMFKITLWYGGVGDTRYEYVLAGALAGRTVSLKELPRKAGP